LLFESEDDEIKFIKIKKTNEIEFIKKKKWLWRGEYIKLVATHENCQRGVKKLRGKEMNT
jgi:hypothetical protein